MKYEKVGMIYQAKGGKNPTFEWHLICKHFGCKHRITPFLVEEGYMKIWIFMDVSKLVILWGVYVCKYFPFCALTGNY